MTLQRQLLHQGGTPGTWGSLGLWAGAPDYAGACRALAVAVGQAAQLHAGQRVLAIACGAGDELLLWRQQFTAGALVGIEPDRPAFALAQQAAQTLPPGAPAVLVNRPVAALAGHPALAAAFDAVLCVDAAYHLSPRSAWLRQALGWLRPGGRLAYTDLTLRSGRTSPLLRAAAGLCGVPVDGLLPLPQQLQRLQTLGFVEAGAQALDAAVLDGFATFARRQARTHGLRPWQAGWRTVAATAALIPPCRAAGLGYALLWARKPAAG